MGLSLYSDNKLGIIGTCRCMCKVKAFVILIKSMFVKCTAHGILAMVSWSGNYLQNIKDINVVF